jgi:ABC-type phosphate/phosphonate transport system substrate-binding protein
MAWRVAFPMYNVSPRIGDGYRALAAALLAGLREQGFDEPVDLATDRTDDMTLIDFWRRPDLLLSQTCGYPYLNQLRGEVSLIATPVYDFAGCGGSDRGDRGDRSDYASAMIVRAGAGIATLADARGRIAAANDRHSNSGMNALRHAVAPLAREGRFFSKVTWSGSHRASLALVQSGAADIAAIDCVTLGYLRREEPDSLDGLTLLDYSAASPGLPLIAGAAVPPAVCEALRRALLAPSPALAGLMPALSLLGFEVRGDDDYQRIGAMEAEARGYAYPVLG